MMISELIARTIRFNQGDPRRIAHFLKVYSFAKTIGELEQLDSRTQEILEAAAVLHDIGIHASEEKYGSSAGNYQELEGPPIAEKILAELSFAKDVQERVCYLIGHHHSYANIDGIDYQILVEADFLVNMHEDAMNEEQIMRIREKIFKTETGTRFLNELFLAKYPA